MTVDSAGDDRPLMTHVWGYDEVLARFPETSWQHRAALDSIAHVMSNSGRDFPCMFAVRAVAQRGFYYVFGDAAGSNLADGLREFLRNARTLGPYSSLSYVFPPEDVLPLEAYNSRFWITLKRLHDLDERPWPPEIPTSLHDSGWTFCFDGEAMFPLCLTPAHVKRRTRHATHFTIAFQPRWTFKHHLPDADIMQKYSVLIQDKIRRFDSTPVSPQLGLYGSGYLDAHKYFFHDDNVLMGHPDSLDAPLPREIAGVE